MPKTRRVNLGGLVYHVLNRANGRTRIFDSDSDYSNFESVIERCCRKVRMRVLSYCIMPNHWHLVLWPYEDGDLSDFMQRLTIIHTQMWNNFYESCGHLYQGRFRSFPIQAETHYLNVCRYVEQNALRSNLVKRAEDWRWSSLWRRQNRKYWLLEDGPVKYPTHWLQEVNTVPEEKELTILKTSLLRGRPYGENDWVRQTAEKLGLISTLRPKGRPRSIFKKQTPSTANYPS